MTTLATIIGVVIAFVVLGMLCAGVALLLFPHQVEVGEE